MISLYAPDEVLLARLRGLLPAETAAFTEWGRFERAIPTTTCSVVGMEWLHEAAAFPELCALRSRHPLHPVVLVTRWEPHNARLLGRLEIDDVVWFREMDHSLLATVKRAGACGRLRGLAEELRGAQHLSPRLRQALQCALDRSPPLRSVGELAELMNCHRRTLSHHWRSALGVDPPLRLEDFLDWVLLLHASMRRAPGLKWSGVATQLRVHEQTLGRLSQRLAGLTLRELHHCGSARLLELFRQRALSPLLDAARTPILP